MSIFEEKTLGFGCMRLPLLDGEDAISFNFPLIEQLFDTFLQKGFTYFDTAYTYHGYHGGTPGAPFSWRPSCRCGILRMRRIWRRFFRSSWSIAA